MGCGQRSLPRRHTGVHRYTFPASNDAHLTVDIEHCLSRGNRQGWEDQHFDGGEVHIVSSHEITGVGRYSGGWNRGGEYSVYFDLVTDAPVRASRTWAGRSITNAKEASVSTEIPLGAILDFSTKAGQQVHVKVGISFVSIDRRGRIWRQRCQGLIWMEHAAALSSNGRSNWRRFICRAQRFRKCDRSTRRCITRC